MYFHNALEVFDKRVPKGPAVAFLHSYAGHGDYAENLPAWAHLPVPAFFNGASRRDIYGGRLTNLDISLLNDYDDAMLYIDGNLAHLLKQIAKDPRPTAFLYFSNHGDSAITGSGHDSSRLQHEMTHVPFLMYFNRPARNAVPELFAAFKAGALANRSATLEQVSATIMTLLGMQVTDDKYPYHGIGLDPESTLPPIVVRHVEEGVSYLRSHGAARKHHQAAHDATDPATTIWLNRRGRNKKEVLRPALCYGSANSFAKANRGAMVADCLAVRLAFNGNNLAVAPITASEGSGWLLQAVAHTAATHGIPLWLDARALPAARVCSRVGKILMDEDNPPHARLILELGLKTMQPIPESCTALQSSGQALFLHVPESALSSTTTVSQWAKAVHAFGWPPNYSLGDMPRTGVLRALLDGASIKEAKWALSGISVKKLPWGLPDDDPETIVPSILLINTQWDINSRK